jgi:hydrogenase maturation factor
MSKPTLETGTVISFYQGENFNTSPISSVHPDDDIFTLTVRGSIFTYNLSWDDFVQVHGEWVRVGDCVLVQGDVREEGEGLFADSFRDFMGSIREQVPDLASTSTFSSKGTKRKRKNKKVFFSFFLNL